MLLIHRELTWALEVIDFVNYANGDLENFFLNLKRNFIYFWPRWVFAAFCGLSLVVERAVLGLLTVVPSLLAEHRLSCSVACGIFQTRDRTCVPCIGRQILIHCTTSKVLV